MQNWVSVTRIRNWVMNVANRSGYLVAATGH